MTLGTMRHLISEILQAYNATSTGNATVKK